ncbi:MAG: inorganic diphosphatase [Crocinitomicaceae bacterium]|nr:inorganic diphosphatase [Crocinitomicaceae bacterium]
MRKHTLFFLSSISLFASCTSNFSEKEETDPFSKEALSDSINLLTDIRPKHEDGDINAIIEIPSGTIEKWELEKTNGQVEREFVNGLPRTINYIGYPGNYGMIPQTLLSKENGGDGDPLDILVLGAPVKRNSILKCKIIGVLYLLDRGEQDDKLIAVSEGSPLYDINSIKELNENFKGVSDIIQLWFSNYKGPGKMKSKGFGEKDVAISILESSIKEYNLNL